MVWDAVRVAVTGLMHCDFGASIKLAPKSLQLKCYLEQLASEILSITVLKLDGSTMEVGA
jgi:hypothetical protein